MSIITEKNITCRGKKNFKVMLERYNSAMEMVADLRKRKITSPSFRDKSKETFDSWEGVKTYDEALNYMQNGYQPTVDALKESVKPSVKGDVKRISFKNDIVGGNPIVPLAMIGVPNCMQNTYIRQIKAKVIDVYYDMTCSCGTSSKSIIEAGQKILGTILRLEQQGYKFNLYAVQSYCNSSDADMLCVKVKSSNQPLDIKRMSYTLTHTSFFRVLGFDWYSRTPKGTYRCGYGRALGYDLDSAEKIGDFAKKMFGNNAVYLSAAIMNSSEYKNNKDEYINNAINVK